MKSDEIRQKFLKFFEKRGHMIIPSASLVPENDPSVLFNTAGMQPLVPYLSGEKHPAGTKIVNVQKCVRTTDIDEVGDNTHLTFFEMLGNWSLGDYFKEDAIKWSFEFLTDKEEGLGLDSKRLYVTVFEGDENVPKDEASFKIWKDIFEKASLDPEKRIFFMSAESNWWPQPKKGDSYSGPCGSDSEMFYDVTGKLMEGMTKEEFIKADDTQKVVEIWNDVFMEYKKRDGKIIGKLQQKNVDTGAGLERLTAMMQGVDNVYDTDVFRDLMKKLDELSNVDILKPKRIIADHIRTAVFMLGDGVIPSNTDRGYVLRRIIRRAVRYMDTLDIEAGNLLNLSEIVISQYGHTYENLESMKKTIQRNISDEESKFKQTLKRGLKEFNKFYLDVVHQGIEKKEDINNKITEGQKIIPGFVAFRLFSTYGFPIELTIEVAKETGLTVDVVGFEEEMKKHQELSQTASAGKFKGGLSGHNKNSIKLHTVTHLLHQALREVLGNHIGQKGSNITSERLRFDFSHSEKLTDEEKQKVESLVNKKIQEGLEVKVEEISTEKAKEQGALGVFNDKYGNKVKVYSMGDFTKNEQVFSKEICGGPHVKNTNELGKFKIKKESASSAGIRRIKGILEL